MNNLFSAFFLLSGALFCLIAALGVLRFPDLLMRMHASTKAGTLGVSLVLISTAIHYGSAAVIIKVVLTIAFLFIAGPVAAHVLARAGYFINLPLWEGSVIDELREHYNVETHELESD
jgi:multicomponent Na+:H+ antiporter subunit G